MIYDYRINLHVSEETSKIFREIIYLNNYFITTEKNNTIEKMNHAYLIINFVVDTITTLYNQILKFHEFNFHTNLNENNMILEVINKYLYCICKESNLQSTKDLINLCFKKGFLKINSEFEFTYPKYFMFENLDAINFYISEKENIEINEIIIAYAEYIIEDGSFMGQADLNILKSIDLFKDYKEEISITVVSQYSFEKSHFGNFRIKADGNCLLSCFIFEYLTKKNLLKSIYSD